MKLERKTYRDGNLHPKAFNCLKLLPESFTYHSDHTERHPFSIYSLSIQNVMQSFHAVLDELDQISTALFNADGHLDYPLDKLPGLQKELLYALQFHIEDCYRILKVIHPFNSNGKEKSVESWLDKVKHPGYKNFHAEIKHYRNSFALAVNKLKHNGAQLRPIMMYSMGHSIVAHTIEKRIQTFPKNARITGYFVEGMQPNGHIGPDCEIHPPNGTTAISLNYDLRYHFTNLYRVGHHLNTAILRTVRKLHGIELPHDAYINDTASQYNIESIAERVSKLSPLFFENEFSKKTPDIKFHRHNKNADLILEFPGSQYMAWEGEVMIYSKIQVDAVCRHYQLPYK
ncbi:hypothetical protein QUA00_29155 [Microcoleus sp. T2B6]|uniref:hypothetical protein n=1 Tax=Microcoleus sp. T2B6 TaxID=3055424 RepID=UPI002FD31850